MTMTKTFSGILTLGMICVCLTCFARFKPVHLTCEYEMAPQHIDSRQPVFRWKNEGDIRLTQHKIWIRVASDKERLEDPDVWESGPITSESPGIQYPGNPPLESGKTYWWQVRLESLNGEKSTWSAPASFGMGILSPREWKARWIGAPEALLSNDAAPLFRKSFTPTGKVQSAKLYCSGLGYFEARINDQKVSQDVLVPNQTNYGKRPDLIHARVPIEDHFSHYKVFYLGFDVTPLIRTGSNDLDILLGNGFYNAREKWVMPYGSPRMMAQLLLTYTDGRKDTILSDPGWKVAQSPIVMNGVYQGEGYDARITPTHWLDAQVVSAPDGELCAQTGPSDRVMEHLKPKKIEKLADGKYRIDFGEEISGWIRISNFTAPAGQKIDIDYLSESPQGKNYYICSGNGKESYAARFSWFVFRTVEISNWPGTLKPDQIEAEAVYSRVERSGYFSCSNALFNQIDRIWCRSQTDNMHGGIASDCPHRERSGYTGDGQVAMNMVMHHFDARQFYRKWIQDILDAQNPSSGYVPNGAPWQPGCGGGPAWGAAVCIMPWEYHQFYDDTVILKQAYPAMKAYFSYLENWKTPEGIFYVQHKVKDKVFKWLNLGDWSAPGDLPREEVVHTFYAWLCADIIAKSALCLGKINESQAYQLRALNIQKSFVKHFYLPDTKSFGSHGENVFALYMGLPSNLLGPVKESLKQDILQNGGHLMTGIFGTRYLFEVLAENGLNQLAYEILNKRDFPSFGHWIEQGATTTWERWDGRDSRNHPMFGGGLIWFYKYLCGISPLKPGFKSILIQPYIPEGISQAHYELETAYGKVSVEWKKENARLRLKFTIPSSCSGHIVLPIQNITVDELRAQSRGDELYLDNKYDGNAEFECKAGTYELIGF